jgi:hypothetical protein
MTAQDLLKHKFIKGAKKTELLKELVDRKKVWDKQNGKASNSNSEEEEKDDAGMDSCEYSSIFHPSFSSLSCAHSFFSFFSFFLSFFFLSFFFFYALVYLFIRSHSLAQNAPQWEFEDDDEAPTKKPEAKADSTSAHAKDSSSKTKRSDRSKGERSDKRSHRKEGEPRGERKKREKVFLDVL